GVALIHARDPVDEIPGVERAICVLVHDQPLAVLERGHHARPVYLEVPDEDADEGEDQQGENRCLEDLPKRGLAASGGGVGCSCIELALQRWRGFVPMLTC